MYHYLLNICVFSISKALVNALEKLPVFSGFEYRIYFFQELTSDAIAQSDVLIYDFPWSAEAQKLIDDNKKATAITVLCAKTVDLKDEYYTNGKWTGVWRKPWQPSLPVYLLSQYLYRLKLEADMTQYKINLDTLIDSVPDLIWFKDLKGAHMLVNKKFCETVGKTKEQVRGRGHYYIWDITPEEYETGEYVCLDTEAAVLKAKQTCLFDEQVKCKDGMRQFKTYKTPIMDKNKTIIGTVGIARDVTDIWNMQTELNLVLERLPFPVMLLRADGIISTVNGKFLERFGTTKSEMTNVQYKEVIKKCFPKFTEHEHSKSIDVELVIDGAVRVFEMSKEPVPDVFGKLRSHLCVFRDVTEERQYHEKMLLLANTDPLTGVYNRRYCKEKMEQYLRESVEFSLVSIDLDDLKSVNDSLGHDAGDDYIISVVDIFSSETFGRDLFCRIGGDEFILLLFCCNQEQAEAKMQKIEKRINNLKKPYNVGISYGITAVEVGTNISADQLLSGTDRKMYDMKNQKF